MKGGFHVSAPADDAATSALRNYLFLIGATLEEIFRTRLFLDTYMFYLAMRRMTSEAASSLLNLLEELPDDDDRLRIARL